MKLEPPAGAGRRWLLAGLACLALAVAVLVRLLAAGPSGGPETAAAPGLGGAGIPSGGPEPRAAGAGETAADGGRARPDWEFAPEEGLAIPDCGVEAGWGMPAGDVALVVVPDIESPGARFAVLDGDGTLFGGDLPFRPNHWRLGRRADGAVVAAFADRRRNSKVSRPPESPEPLWVYVDGGLAYESEKAWDFGVARDGSSFFAVEPLAGEASRLVIHNLNLGVETHHDLDREFNPFTEGESPYGAFYSQSAEEVMFWPPQQRDGVLGDYWFYPVGGGAPRVVRAVPRGTGVPHRQGGAATAMDPRMVRIERIAGRTDDRLIFDSSETVYHIADRSESFPGDGPSEVAKYVYSGYGGADGPQRTEVWRRLVPMRASTFARAPDGPWLALADGGRRVFALDTSTGEYALVFPSLEDPRLRVPEDQRRRQVPGMDMNYAQLASKLAQLERSRGVLGLRATVEDVGTLSGVWFEDSNRLVVPRYLGRRPNLRKVHDVFEMDTVELDEGPAFWIEKDDIACGLGGLRGFDVRDGRLVYPGPRVAPADDHAWMAASQTTGRDETP